MKAKVINSNRGIVEFEGKLNSFLSDPEIDVIDVKYSIIEPQEESYPAITYSALVLYK
jgi:hypothetical protein